MINDNDKLLSVKIINLLIIDNFLGYKTKNNALIKKALGIITVPEIVHGLEQDNYTIIRLKELISWLLTTLEESGTIDKLDLRTRTEYCGQYEAWIKESIYDLMENCTEENRDDLLATNKGIIKFINDRLTAVSITNTIKELYKDGVINNGIKTPKEFALNAIAKFTAFALNSDLDGPEILKDGQGEVNFNDAEENVISSMAKLLAKDKEKRNGNMVLKTGYEAINLMLRGGVRYGEFILSIAMRYNFKSGLILNIFRQIATYNEAPVFENGEIPTLVFLVFEQDLSAVYYFLYAGIIENKTRRPLTEEEKNVSEETMAYVVYKHFKSTGWNLVIRHQFAHKWSYEDIFNFTDNLRKNKCKIVGMFVDYLYQLPKTGCTDSKIIGEDTKKLYEIIRAKYKLEDTFFWTPHQMSKSARDWLDFGQGLLVENVVGKGLLEGCGSLDNVVDIELYQHKEYDRKSGNTALTIMRGKHKLEGEVDDRAKLLAICWFNQYQRNVLYESGILDDINDIKMYSRKLSEAPIGLRGDSVVFDDSYIEGL